MSSAMTLQLTLNDLETWFIVVADPLLKRSVDVKYELVRTKGKVYKLWSDRALTFAVLP